MMPGVLRFPAEISILKKEVFNNWYKLRTYYLAQLITSTPIHVTKLKMSLILRFSMNAFNILSLDVVRDSLRDRGFLHH